MRGMNRRQNKWPLLRKPGPPPGRQGAIPRPGDRPRRPPRPPSPPEPPERHIGGRDSAP
jgi:hypothetical protein